MSTVALPAGPATTDRVAGRALRAAAVFWFIAAATGQVAFAASVALFYGRAIARGDWLAMNNSMTHGWIPGAPIGNAVVVMHLAAAVMILASGALQLIPALRTRAPAFHRWNGRAYLAAAAAISIGGLYMVWVRGTVGDLPQHLASTLNAALIVLFGFMAVRRAMAGRIAEHRRWALRLYMVVGGVWFFRVALMLSFVVFGGPYGFDPVSFTGPMLWALAFGAYLLPLLLLEVYLRAQQRASHAAFRWSAAAAIATLTLAMIAGTGAAAASLWMPRLQPVFAERASIGEAMSVLIRAEGVDKAEQFYRNARVAAPSAWSLAERELNSLGYQLLRGGRATDAIRIFQLNAEFHPASSNVVDSLAEAYLVSGDIERARINYRLAVERDPDNAGARRALERLAP